VIEIRHRESGQVIRRLESHTLQEAAASGLLYGADLCSANQRGWDLSGIDFGYADLRGADLSRANLLGTRLDRADLAEADLSGAQFDHLTGWPPGLEPQEQGAVKVEWRSGPCRLDPRHRQLREEAGRHWKDCMARLRAGQTRAAIRELRRTVLGFPFSPGSTAYARFLQGLIRLARRHTVKAQAEFEEAISVYPHLAAAHVALAYTLLLRGKPDDAFTAFQQALRIDPHDRDLYLPLLHAFEQSDSLQSRFTEYEQFLFPTVEHPLSPAAVPNPVELFLERQPSELEKALCELVLSELIDRQPVTVLAFNLLKREELPDYAKKRLVCWVERPASLPELHSIWEFVSGSGCRVEARVMIYWERMEEQGLDREQIKLRMEIVRSFQALCEELGYIRDDEDNPVGDDDWY
jgi:tetratricopeptide (TPR) repeat protein